MGNHHMGNYEEILVRKHLKRTKARVMIMKVLDKSLPMTAGEVYEAVRGKDTRLSLSTVYRNCEALAEKGLLLRSTMLDDGLTRYEYAQGTPVHGQGIRLRSGRTESRNLRLLQRLPGHRERQSL